ncbi:UNVERIFIED_ORG: hypothetical protein ABIB52_004439 [Arthrobacter sp. UYCu721]
MTPARMNSDHLNSDRPDPDRSRHRTGPQAGHTRIAANALTHTIGAVTAEAFKVPVAEVKVSLRDDAGRLAISVRVPVTVLPLADAARHPEQVSAGGGTLYERADAARATIAGRLHRLTGVDIGGIDLRLTAAHHPAQEGVR